MNSVTEGFLTRQGAEGLIALAIRRITECMHDARWREYIAGAVSFAAFAWEEDEKEREGLYPYLHDVEGPAKLLCFFEPVDDDDLGELLYAYIGPMDVTPLVAHMVDDLREAAYRQLCRERDQSEADVRMPSTEY